MNLKFYDLNFDPDGNVEGLYYFEVSKKHWDSIEKDDYITEYLNRKIIWERSNKFFEPPWKEGTYKIQFIDYKKRNLFLQIFDDEKYWERDYSIPGSGP